MKHDQQTNIMTNSIIPISVAVVLLFTSCKKEMSPGECRSNYDEIIAYYERTSGEAIAAFGRGALTQAEAQRRIAEAAKTANARADLLDDCCCWSKL